jgi:hypothetical protein
MNNTKYVLSSSSLSYTLGFENDLLYCEMVRRLKDCRIDQVTRVVKKKTSLGAGDDISFRIFYSDNGKEKKFPWVQASLIDANTKAFFDDLKERCNDQVIWEDKLVDSTKTADGGHVYDLQYLPFGYGGAGLSRGVQLWIYMICLAVLIFPLIYFIIILVKGGYRVYTDDYGFEIRRFSGRKFSWNELTNVSVTNINVRDAESNSTTKIMRIDLQTGNKNQKLVMRHDHAVPLLKELVQREKVNQELIKNFL